MLLGGAGLASSWMDNALTVFNLLACTGYLYVASGTVYAATGVARVIKSALLALAAGAIVLGYRFLIFVITLYVI